MAVPPPKVCIVCVLFNVTDCTVYWVQLSLYKILFHFAAFMWETILPFLPPPTCIARTISILLHVYCARYDAPFVCYTLYNIGIGNIV